MVPIARTGAGIALGVVLSMMGIAVAWGLFIFFGLQSLNWWLASLFIGAGLGAGTGGFFAWLQLDQENIRVLGLMALVIGGAGIFGAWVGYEFGSGLDVECCAEPTVSPVYYTALGATGLANAAGLAFAAVRAWLGRKGPTKIQNAVH